MKASPSADKKKGKPGGKSNQQVKVIPLPITFTGANKSNDQSISQLTNSFEVAPQNLAALQNVMKSTFKGTASFGKIVETSDSPAKDGRGSSGLQSEMKSDKILAYATTKPQTINDIKDTNLNVRLNEQTTSENELSFTF